MNLSRIKMIYSSKIKLCRKRDICATNQIQPKDRFTVNKSNFRQFERIMLPKKYLQHLNGVKKNNFN